MRTAHYICSLLGSLLIFAGVYHKLFGLPDGSDLYLLPAAFVCYLASYAFRRRAQRRGAFAQQPAHPNWLQRAWLDRSKRFWLTLTLVAPLAVASPFLAPYEGFNLPFSQNAVISGICFILFAVVLWFALRRRKKDA